MNASLAERRKNLIDKTLSGIKVSEQLGRTQTSQSSIWRKKIKEGRGSGGGSKYGSIEAGPKGGVRNGVKFEKGRTLTNEINYTDN